MKDPSWISAWPVTVNRFFTDSPRLFKAVDRNVQQATTPCAIAVLLGIAQLIMLGELAVNRALDNLELAAEPRP
nr:hypothetical protein [Pseudomonas sp. DR 5-09]